MATSNDLPEETPRRATRVSFADAPTAKVTLPPPAPGEQSQALASVTPPAAVPARANIRLLSEEEVSKLGAGASQNMDTISNRLLSVQRSGDSGVLGQQLNQLIAEAKGLDPKSMEGKGVLGKVMGLFSNAKDKILANYDTVQGRINTLIGQIDREMGVQRQRLVDLNEMAEGLRSYHQNLEAVVAQGKQAIADFDVAIAAMEPTVNNDAFAANDLADLRDRRNVLAKRVDDFERNMLLIKQTAPSILMMKQNARDLITTFDDIKVTTIPAWRGVFSQYMISLDQRRGADLTTNVRDASNQAIRQQADQLGQNATAIATARQRSSIDIETLQYNQQKLMETLDSVAAIEKKGQTDREAARPQLAALEQALVQRFARPSASSGQ